MADPNGHKRVLKPIRWIRPLAPDHKFAPADAPVHFNPGKFRSIPGQLPLQAAVTEHCGSDSPHAGHNWSDRDGDHWCPGTQGDGRD